MTADRPSVEDMLAQARAWPRDGFGEGRWFHAMADEIQGLHQVLRSIRQEARRDGGSLDRIADMVDQELP